MIVFLSKTHKNQVGRKLSGTHQRLAYADNASLLEDNIHTTEKNAAT
jgi:hypothetical protein